LGVTLKKAAPYLQKKKLCPEGAQLSWFGK